MDLITLVTTCALTVDPKLMHALVWHQSGSNPWAVSVEGEQNPRVFRNIKDAVREARNVATEGSVRVGLAGVPVPPQRVSATIFSPCRNVAMAANRIAQNETRCKSHGSLKADPVRCAVAVYRGSWTQPDVRFATEVMATVAKSDAPNFDMPRGTSTEIDTASDNAVDADPPLSDATAFAADHIRGWSSALFPSKSTPSVSKLGENNLTTPRSTAVSSDSLSNAATPATIANNRELFVRRSTKESSQ